MLSWAVVPPSPLFTPTRGGNIWRIFFIFRLAILPLVVLALVLFFLDLIPTANNTGSLGIAGRMIKFVVIAD